MKTSEKFEELVLELDMARINLAEEEEEEEEEACIVVSMKDITERKKIEQERDLISSWIVQAREEEKKRFATALHDAIGTMVVGISSSLLIAEEQIRHGSASQAAAKLSQTKKLVKEITATMKKICVDIRPPALEISGLAGALVEIISQFRISTKIKTCHSINLPDAIGKSDSPVNIIIYRLVQEALNNAAKHSKAKNLELIINHDHDKVMVTVSDDGLGFNMDNLRLKKSSLGLKIMREQVESAGGNLLIDSKPGRGTDIKAEFPLLSGRAMRNVY